MANHFSDLLTSRTRLRGFHVVFFPGCLSLYIYPISRHSKSYMVSISILKIYICHKLFGSKIRKIVIVNHRSRRTKLLQYVNGNSVVYGYYIYIHDICLFRSRNYRFSSIGILWYVNDPFFREPPTSYKSFCPRKHELVSVSYSRDGVVYTQNSNSTGERDDQSYNY